LLLQAENRLQRPRIASNRSHSDQIADRLDRHRGGEIG
jgi:hypothetical protein